MNIIGYFSKKIIDLLNLDIEEGTPIFIGENNIEHIQARHPVEYEIYFPQINDILSDPDYVGRDPKTRSIDFVKVFQLGSEYIQVSVRVTSGGKYIARTLFMLSTFKAERYIEDGTLKRVP